LTAAEADERSRVAWRLALRAAELLAIDPIGLGGATLRAPPGPARDTWLETFRTFTDDERGSIDAPPPLPRGDERGRGAAVSSTPGTGVHPESPPPATPRKGEAGGIAEPPRPWRRMPPGITEGRLIGGLDLAATLVAGRPVAERGLLAEADGGVLVVPMAERLGASTAAQIGAALDSGEVIVERDGIARRAPARFACVLLDEGIDDERAPTALADRLAFKLDLAAILPRAIGEEDRLTLTEPTISRVAGEILVPDDVVSALCAAGLAFGVPSLRIATLALRAAKASARLAGRGAVEEEDVSLAAALVIAPRATTVPAARAEPDESEPDGQARDEQTDDESFEDQGEAPEPDAPEPPPEDGADQDSGNADEDVLRDPQALTDRLVEATRAAIPAGLLAELGAAAAGPATPGATGRAGAARQSAKRGRPAGVRRGMPGHGVRLAVVETLRAAAPWQRLRRARMPASTANRVLVRREDFRVGRYKQKSETMTLFVVDASGSAALHRLAEVKGAVELILAECYVRRDSVALIAFRGAGAELILPPTRSLVRAKRALAGQAGGGGTPLARAIDASLLVIEAAARRGQTPVAVFLTDGKANIGRSGRPGRAEAEADALAAAQAFHASQAAGKCAALVLDIAPRPGEAARRLATAMGARYIPLPYADARAMSRVVLAAGPVSRPNASV
jgi:magnesium chelatase subunit D